MKRILSLILLISSLMTLCMMPSCGSTGAATKPTNVFRETSVALPEHLTGNNTNINQYIKNGDNVYMLVYSYDSETWAQTYFIQPFDLVSGTFGERIDIETAQTENSNTNLNAFTVGDDGSIYLMLETYTYSDTGYEQSSELRVIRNGVTESIEIDLLSDMENGGFYVNTMLAADDGTLILASWNGIRLVTPDGEVKKVELGEDGSMEVQSMTKIDGKIYATVWYYGENNYGSKLVEFDHTTGTFGEELDIKTDHAYNMILGPGYDYYYNDSTCVWGIDTKTGEMTEVINFINSDINGSDVRIVIPISPDRFFTVLRVSTTGASSTAFAFLERVPDEEIVTKKLLRMAVNYASYDLRSRVIAFNKANDTYRITIDDYSRFNTDENYSAGLEKLNSDIIAGNIPDIFMVNENMPYDVYAAKGIFADLYALMDADADFDRSLYLENIFKAYEYDGRLLTLIPSFQINTFAAKAELVDGMEGWTMREFMEFAKAHPDMSMFDYEFNRATFIEMFMLFAREQFIDPVTGECSFDSDEFRELLTFASTLSEESFWESAGDDTQSSDFWQEYENRFVDNRVLLLPYTLYNFDYSYKDLLNYSLKSEPSFVGFPVSDGNGALITSYNEYAISARSDFKEGAWEFVKSFISEEAQMPAYVDYDGYGYWNYPVSGLPVYRPALDKMVEIAMTPTEQNKYGPIIGGAVMMPAISSSSVVVVESEAAADTVVSDDIEISDDTVVDDSLADDKIAVDTGTVDIPIDSDEDIIIDDYTDPYAIPLTRDQIDKCLALIEGTTQVARYDTDLNDIINEELDPFFAGKQSLDDTVDHIQNRVSIYIGESK